MHKLTDWLNNNLVELGVFILLILIPLYPKLPLIGVSHTWVYIRLDDVVIALVVLSWLIKRRFNDIFKTPLSYPIIIYWIVGGVSLLFSLIFLRAQLANFFPSVAALSYLRRIEYMILFFVVISTIKNISIVKKYLLVMGIVLVLVCIYGFGQRLWGFPAFLTMNEEFAKGTPLYLSASSRLTSTFAGHYDLAAYLVLMIGIFASVIFAVKNRFLKLGIFILLASSYVLLLQTASRVSIVVYIVVVCLILILQKQKKYIIPVIILSLLVMNLVTGAADRFAKTFRVERVVYDAQTGKAVGTVENLPESTETSQQPYEDLPLGTGYINIPVNKSNPVEATQVAYIKKSLPTSLKTASTSSEIATVSGEFLIKRALVYDISFTTRFQGTWPRAWKAFTKSPLLGTGYSSIELASDNSYLRALGETGILGFVSFMAILSVFALVIKQGYLKIQDKFVSSLLIGIGAGVLGVALNAILIDIFEASKVAYMLWMTIAMAIGIIIYLIPKPSSLLKDGLDLLKLNIIPPLVLIIVGIIQYVSSIGNYFVGDDFTWLKWADTANLSRLINYFTNSEGFFYRPLAKIYFALVYPIFGLRPQGYHFVDILLHLGIVVGLYLIVYKVSGKKLIAFIAGWLLLISPINAESVLWISSTSALMSVFFYSYAFLAYLFWQNTTKIWKWVGLFISIILFILSLSSHELATTLPLLIIFYDILFHRINFNWKKNSLVYLIYFVILFCYLYLRNFIAGSHWMNGDYSYNLNNLIFNVPGNLIGYFGELLVGLRFDYIYQSLRDILKINKIIALIALILSGGSAVWIYNLKIKKYLACFNIKIIIFAIGWFVILLLPFIALGNIAERHVYPAHLGYFVLLSVIIVAIYLFVNRYHQKIAIVVLILIVSIISTFYWFDYRDINQQWFDAGEITNRVLLAIGSNYAEFDKGSLLYFVNLPIKNGNAWVFPVGLDDGLWLIYRNDHFTTYRINDLSQAFSVAKGNNKAYIFNYSDGQLEEENQVNLQ